MKRLTERDEFGNADIIGVDSEELQINLDLAELNRVTVALNKLAAYEDLEEQCTKETTWGLKMLLQKWKEFFEDIQELNKYRNMSGKIIKKLEEIKNPMYSEDGSLIAQKAFIRIDEAIEIVKQFTS